MPAHPSEMGARAEQMRTYPGEMGARVERMRTYPGEIGARVERMVSDHNRQLSDYDELSASFFAIWLASGRPEARPRAHRRS